MNTWYNKTLIGFTIIFIWKIIFFYIIYSITFK